MNTQNEILTFDNLLTDIEATNKAKKVKQSLTQYLYKALSEAPNRAMTIEAVNKLALDYMTKNRNYFSKQGLHFETYNEAVTSLKKLVKQYNAKNDDKLKATIQKHVIAMKSINKRLNNAVKYALINNDQKPTNINFNNEYEFGGKIIDDSIALVSK